MQKRLFFDGSNDVVLRFAVKIVMLTQKISGRDVVQLLKIKSILPKAPCSIDFLTRVKECEMTYCRLNVCDSPSQARHLSFQNGHEWLHHSLRCEFD